MLKSQESCKIEPAEQHSMVSIENNVFGSSQKVGPKIGKESTREDTRQVRMREDTKRKRDLRLINKGRNREEKRQIQTISQHSIKVIQKSIILE